MFKSKNRLELRTLYAVQGRDRSGKFVPKKCTGTAHTGTHRHDLERGPHLEENIDDFGISLSIFEPC